MPRALFRCDASRSLGGGHVARSMTLAGALAAQGWEIVFATNREAADTVPALAQSGWRLLQVQDDAGPASLGSALAGRADLLVVDHYGLDAAFEAACRAWAGVILVVDDLADRPHDCDLLLDALLGRQADVYRPLVPDGARLLLGADYALLRPGFARLREAALARRDGRLRRILVCLGASDPHGVTAMAVRALADLGGATAADVVVGDPADAEALRADIARAGTRVALHVATQRMPELMAAADLAVGSAGGLSWERCAVGLPALLVVTADNQRANARFLLASRAALDCGDWLTCTAERIALEVARCAADPRLLQAMGSSAAALCDGRGVERVAAAVREAMP